jgi:hypothetical protein
VPKGWWGHTGPVEDWQALTDAGTRSVHVTNPDWVDVHCQRQIVLRSNYIAVQPAPPPTEQPYPKDGLVVAPARPVEAIEIIPIDSAETRTLLGTVTDAFNHAERNFDIYSGHVVRRRARETAAPTIEAVYAAGTSTRMYYVEAVREYRKQAENADSCIAIAYGQGWLVRDSRGVRSLTMKMNLLGCERDGAEYMLPLGALHLSDKWYWIAQFSGWDEEHFVVLDVKPTRIDTALWVRGGECQ